jgi:hypothetical protein
MFLSGGVLEYGIFGGARVAKGITRVPVGICGTTEIGGTRDITGADDPTDPIELIGTEPKGGVLDGPVLKSITSLKLLIECKVFLWRFLGPDFFLSRSCVQFKPLETQ